jgi:hypothetical protein
MNNNSAPLSRTLLPNLIFIYILTYLQRVAYVSIITFADAMISHVNIARSHFAATSKTLNPPLQF